jgi:AraC-type DNA-binding domain-containing proteins
MENKYELRIWGRSYNPANWFHNPYYLINRIYYICGGSAYYRNTKELKTGFAYIFPASVLFEVSQNRDNPVDHIYFDFFSYHKIIGEECIEIDLTAMPSLCHIFSAAMEDFNDAVACKITGRAYFSLITALLSGQLLSSEKYSVITQQALKWIHESDIRDLTVMSVAAHVCVNVDYLIRCFRNDMCMTPHRYIAMYKADLATSMISHGNSIKEVAETIGFSSVSAFSTFYKNERQIPPSQINSVDLV